LVKGCFENPNPERRCNSELGNDNPLRGVKDTDCFVQPPSDARLPKDGNKCQADHKWRDDDEQVNDCVNDDGKPNWVAGKGVSSWSTYQNGEKSCDGSSYDTQLKCMPKFCPRKWVTPQGYDCWHFLNCPERQNCVHPKERKDKTQVDEHARKHKRTKPKFRPTGALSRYHFTSPFLPFSQKLIVRQRTGTLPAVNLFPPTLRQSTEGRRKAETEMRGKREAENLRRIPHAFSS
jgi:hypothetical protein